MKDSVISYDDLSKTVGIDRDEIEDWIIDAIVNNIVDARLDQDNETIIINSFTRRNMGKEEWEDLQGKFNKARKDFSTLLTLIRPQ